MDKLIFKVQTPSSLMSHFLEKLITLSILISYGASIYVILDHFLYRTIKLALKIEGVLGTCVWKHVWKYVWMKKCVKIHVMLFKNWKYVFDQVYQTTPEFFVFQCFESLEHIQISWLWSPYIINLLEVGFWIFTPN